MAHDALEYLRKESVDVYNRLHSIAEDAAFVEHVCLEVYPQIPLIPNLRCGAWYSNPSLIRHPDTPAYFKSTDGHFNNWSFILRRANLHLVPIIAQNSGVILVDSTRAGKRIPDALSKTIPIWCAVVNRAIARRFSRDDMDTALYTPPGAVSAQEHSQIEQRIEGWADALFNSSFELPNLIYPLRPIWITPATTTFPSIPVPLTFLPVICLSASKCVELGTKRRTAGFSYIQGSGDDHELWSGGLTPDIFWKHRLLLLSASRSDLPELVQQLVNDNEPIGNRTHNIRLSPVIKVRGRLLLCSLGDLEDIKWDNVHDGSTMAYVLIIPGSSKAERDTKLSRLHDDTGATDGSPSSVAANSTSPKAPQSGNVLRLTHNSPGTKQGQVNFRTHILPASCSFIGGHLLQSESNRVCVACETGRDISVGVVLAVLGSMFDDNGTFVHAREVDKKSLHTRLEWIISSRPVANPARATLKRVNEFLISPGRIHG